MLCQWPMAILTINWGIIRWNVLPLYPNPFSCVQSKRKFSAVSGTTSFLRRILILPAGRSRVILTWVCILVILLLYLLTCELSIDFDIKENLHCLQLDFDCLIDWLQTCGFVFALRTAGIFSAVSASASAGVSSFSLFFASSSSLSSVTSSSESVSFTPAFPPDSVLPACLLSHSSSAQIALNEASRNLVGLARLTRIVLPVQENRW